MDGSILELRTAHPVTPEASTIANEKVPGGASTEVIETDLLRPSKRSKIFHQDLATVER